MFSDGAYLAVGSHDNFIYLFTVSEEGKQYKKHGRLSGHSSYITHFDWSKDSQYLQSNSGDYEILYCKLSSHFAGDGRTGSQQLCTNLDNQHSLSFRAVERLQTSFIRFFNERC